MTQKINHSIYQLIVSVLFSVLLVIPFIFSFFQTENNPSSKNENREKAPFPVFDWKHLDRFPQQFNDFYDDHFSLRPAGIKFYNQFNYFFLKQSPDASKGILGKDNWMFQGKDLDHYRGLVRLTAEQQTKLKNELQQRANFLHERNCKFLLVIIPTKKEIYTEFVPPEFFKYSEFNATDQIIQLAKEVNYLDVIDLKPLLIKSKSIYPEVYHRYDHHWNDYGAYVAYDTIISYIQQQTKTTKKHLINEFTEEIKESNDGSVAKMLGVDDKVSFYRYYLTPKFKLKTTLLGEKYKCPERFPYPWAWERRYQNEDQSLPKLFMVNDSFGEYMYPNLAEHFSNSLFLFDNWEYNLHSQKVIEEQPDFFVISAYESFIPNILENLQREENNVNVSNH
ncbi:MAG: hypothetical protein GXX78_11810 [Bacteroidales bacterium]|nr:hypothetical protein [Bacteroidales bacterium]